MPTNIRRNHEFKEEFHKFIADFEKMKPSGSSDDPDCQFAFIEGMKICLKMLKRWSKRFEDDELKTEVEALNLPNDLHTACDVFGDITAMLPDLKEEKLLTKVLQDESNETQKTKDTAPAQKKQADPNLQTGKGKHKIIKKLMEDNVEKFFKKNNEGEYPIKEEFLTEYKFPNPVVGAVSSLVEYIEHELELKISDEKADDSSITKKTLLEWITAACKNRGIKLPRGRKPKSSNTPQKK